MFKRGPKNWNNSLFQQLAMLQADSGALGKGASTSEAKREGDTMELDDEQHKAANQKKKSSLLGEEKQIEGMESIQKPENTCWLASTKKLKQWKKRKRKQVATHGAEAAEFAGCGGEPTASLTSQQPEVWQGGGKCCQ